MGPRGPGLCPVELETGGKPGRGRAGGPDFFKAGKGRPLAEGQGRRRPEVLPERPLAVLHPENGGDAKAGKPRCGKWGAAGDQVKNFSAHSDLHFLADRTRRPVVERVCRWGRGRSVWRFSLATCKLLKVSALTVLIFDAPVIVSSSERDRRELKALLSKLSLMKA